MLASILATMPPPPTGLRFTPMPPDFLAPVLSLETASYPADEAATEEKLLLRMKEAPQFFMGACDADDRVQGFVCGTCTTAATLTDESMSIHEPDGTTLCIHSVVTSEPWRRKGVALWMLAEYVQKVAALKSVKRVLLLCKENLIPLYEKAGFKKLGLSATVHGQDPWYDMEMILEE